MLGVSQTALVVVNIWGNWGPEQWLKQCRAREEIWDLGKGGWYVQGSFLPSFPPSLSLFSSFFPSFLPPFPPSVLLLMNIIHWLIFMSWRGKVGTGPRAESIKARWGQLDDLHPKNFPIIHFLGPPTCELHVICLDLCPRARWTQRMLTYSRHAHKRWM